MVLELTQPLNRNEYQEYLLRGKGGWFVGLTTFPIHAPNVLKSGSLSILEPSGPIQTCNGIALLSVILYPV